MTEQPTADLLVDLARLARRYPPEAWESLLQWLEDDARRSQIASMLRELAGVSRLPRRRAKRSREKTLSLTQMLEEMQETDPRKAEVLSGLKQKLLDRDVSPSLASIRIFAEVVGLKVPTLKKRDQAVNEVLRQLADLPTDEVERALQKTSAGTRDFGREYERWVNLILGGAGEGPRPP